ncbi:hypothetical protein FACS1894166_11860 [Bacilli bacterium]|nr:hypothetical protein FACS1894166_11860 [Bacilli bacterium]
MGNVTINGDCSANSDTGSSLFFSAIGYYSDVSIRITGDVTINGSCSCYAPESAFFSAYSGEGTASIDMSNVNIYDDCISDSDLCLFFSAISTKSVIHTKNVVFGDGVTITIVGDDKYFLFATDNSKSSIIGPAVNSAVFKTNNAGANDPHILDGITITWQSV